MELENTKQMSENISGSKLGEEAYLESLSVLESALEATDNGILVVGHYGKTLHNNRRFAQMWRLPEEMSVSSDEKTMLNVAMEQLADPQGFLRLVEDLYASPEAESYDTLNFKDGRVFERASLPMLINGKPAGRVWSFRDITARKKAEEALVFSEKRLSMALGVSNAGIWEWDLKTDQVYFDTQFHTILGYIPGELPTDVHEWFTYHHPEDLQVMLSRAETYLQGKVPFYESEHRIRTKSGEWAWVFTRGQNVSRPEAGSSQRFIGIAINTTERKRAEEELVQYREHLEELVARRTAELSATNHELEAFSYSVSHDLRAPLRSIDGFSQMILEDYGDRLDEVGKGYFQRIRNASQHMGELIDDLLKLSRISRAELHTEAVNLSSLARSIASTLQQNQPERNAEFIIQDNIVVQGDRFLLGIALENLFGNAWKFTARQPSGKIEFGITSIGGDGVYFIRDNGVGFDMKYVEKLFTPFQRLHSEKDYPGTGIGLSTVQRIIQRHGGRIWVEAEMEKGATFYFTLS